MTQDTSIPQDLHYSPEHEWLRLNGGVATVGITDYAQAQLGDIVYVSLPRVGQQVSFMQKFGEIESVKVASELFSPVTGEVTAINEALVNSPEQVNSDPFGGGWMITVKLADKAEVDRLLSPMAYAELVQQEKGE